MGTKRNNRRTLPWYRHVGREPRVRQGAGVATETWEHPVALTALVARGHTTIARLSAQAKVLAGRSALKRRFRMEFQRELGVITIPCTCGRAQCVRRRRLVVRIFHMAQTGNLEARSVSTNQISHNIRHKQIMHLAPRTARPWTEYQALRPVMMLSGLLGVPPPLHGEQETDAVGEGTTALLLST